MEDINQPQLLKAAQEKLREVHSRASEILTLCKEPATGHVKPLGVFISHAERDSKLAAAWRDLLTDIFGGLVNVWFSSSLDHLFDNSNGFAGQICQAIEDCDCFISIQTNLSRSRPWPMWEVGLARGLHKTIFIVSYNVAKSDLTNPLDHYDQRDGAVRDDCFRICRAIWDKASVKASMAFAARGGNVNLEPERKPVNSSTPSWDETFDGFFSKYLTNVKGTEASRQHSIHTLHYQITLNITAAHWNDLQDTVRLADDVQVEGDLLLFDYPEYVQSTPWGSFKTGKGLQKMGRSSANTVADHVAAPGSQTDTKPIQIWTKALESTLYSYSVNRSPRIDRRTDPDGLPLWFSQSMRNGYRPFLAEHIVDGENHRFQIIFTELPKFLGGRPDDRDLATLTHLMDFCRMFRWGILEDPSLKAIVEPDPPESLLLAWQEATASLKADYLGRDLRASQAASAFHDPIAARKIQELQRSYSENFKQMETEIEEMVKPDFKPGSSPNSLKERFEAIEMANAQFYLTVSEEFNRQLETYFGQRALKKRVHTPPG